MTVGDDFSITLTEQPTPKDKHSLHERIKAFNDALSVHHREIRGVGAQELGAFIHDADGQLLGGLAAQTYWEWLYVDDLWLQDRLRGKGLGREMMRQVENLARQRGIQKAFLKTFDFQARGFYEKLGYRVVGQLDDYPPGQIFYWMRKDFTRDNLIP